MKIGISPLLFLMAVVLIFFGFGYELVSYFVTIILHEMTHAEVAKKLGYCLNGIKLMPYGASLTGAFEGVRVRDEVTIALAGPFINIVFAIVCIAIWWLIPSSYFITEIFVYSNLFTAIFNLLPIFPLDGGRAVLALLSKKITRKRAYRIMRIFGIFAAVLAGGLFSLTLFKSANFSLGLISIFFFTSTIIPDKNSKYERLYSMAYRFEKIKKGLQIREILVSTDVSCMQLMRMLNSNFYHKFTLVDAKLRPLITITETQLEEFASKEGIDAIVGKMAAQNKNIKQPVKT